MIDFLNNSALKPYIKFKEKYDTASLANQKNIEAICISSYSGKLKEVNARFVNLKFVNKNEFIFFSNYNSPKSDEFIGHNQITALIFWNTINTQIRIKATIKKTSKTFNNEYFRNRLVEKNALAISSNQSKPIESYEQVLVNYNKSLELDNLKKCPDYWGGFSFTPYYFEFWEGKDFRLNKRDAYQLENGKWHHSFLQP